METATSSPVVCEYVFEGGDGADRCPFAWISVDGSNSDALRWLAEESQVPASFHAALLDSDTRPRLVRSGEALLVALRAPSRQRSGQPAELVALRMWVERDRVITVRDSAVEVMDEWEADGPPGALAEGPDAFTAAVVARLVDAVEPLIDDQNEKMDIVEEHLIQEPRRATSAQLGAARRRALELHRYLAPQREVLIRLSTDRPEWVREPAATVLREAANSGSRYLEELQSARDHAAIVQEELTARLGDRLSRRLYLFTVIASIFLPLTFFTGLLGSNVAGIPFADERWAFGAVVLICVTIAVFQYAILRWLRLL